MKRKPDAMVAVIALFFLGLLVSGFSSLSVGSDEDPVRQAQVPFSASRY